MKSEQASMLKLRNDAMIVGITRLCLRKLVNRSGSFNRLLKKSVAVGLSHLNGQKALAFAP